MFLPLSCYRLGAKSAHFKHMCGRRKAGKQCQMWKMLPREFGEWSDVLYCWRLRTLALNSFSALSSSQQSRMSFELRFGGHIKRLNSAVGTQRLDAQNKSSCQVENEIQGYFKFFLDPGGKFKWNSPSRTDATLRRITYSTRALNHQKGPFRGRPAQLFAQHNSRRICDRHTQGTHGHLQKKGPLSSLPKCPRMNVKEEEEEGGLWSEHKRERQTSKSTPPFPLFCSKLISGTSWGQIRSLPQRRFLPSSHQLQNNSYL